MQLADDLRMKNEQHVGRGVEGGSVAAKREAPE